MRILVLGSDGYIGYPLTIHLLKKGHEVFTVDNFSRRKRVNEIGSESLTPILPATARKYYLRERFKKYTDHTDITLGVDTPGFIKSVLAHFEPHVIVHLAEMPSASWSMRSVNHACVTQGENVIGTLQVLWGMREECPKAHLVKIGTMGEYGTPECDIPEGEIPYYCLEDVSAYCPMHGLQFPRSPGSFYHLSKVHDTYNIIFACKVWRLRSTDIMQGIVFGLPYETGDDEEMTRFDYDEHFGTVINRFCAQVIAGYPLTVYGKGMQRRGFLPLADSINCLTLVIENPPQEGEYRVFNQFGQIHSINNLASLVARSGMCLGLNPVVDHIDNPRVEMEDHYYNPENIKLLRLGYKPIDNYQAEITSLIRRIKPYADKVKPELIMPKTNWR